MFGTNEIVGKAYFKDAPKDSLLVTSRFYTLQGEGPYSGQPAFFLRLAKCNLACSFCDTYFDQGDWQTYDQIFESVAKEVISFYASRNMNVPYWAISGPKCKIVLVITGGEPSLQQNLVHFIEHANHIFARIQIESNGTDVLKHLPRKTTLVVSPKCSEKDGVAVRYLTPRPEMLERADCLKFVMCNTSMFQDTEKFKPYSEVPEWAHRWARETGKPVYVSPMNMYMHEPKKAKLIRDLGKEIDIDHRSELNERISFWEPGLLDNAKNQLNHEYTAEYCMLHGFNLNLQVHLYASLP